MAVTVTVADVAAAVRVGDSAAEMAEMARLLGVATDLVRKFAPLAPDSVANEAAIRIVGYLYDQPYASRGVYYADAVRNSGAQSLLVPWRIHGLGVI